MANPNKPVGDQSQDLGNTANIPQTNPEENEQKNNTNNTTEVERNYNFSRRRYRGRGNRANRQVMMERADTAGAEAGSANENAETSPEETTVATVENVETSPEEKARAEAIQQAVARGAILDREKIKAMTPEERLAELKLLREEIALLKEESARIKASKANTGTATNIAEAVASTTEAIKNAEAATEAEAAEIEADKTDEVEKDKTAEIESDKAKEKESDEAKEDESDKAKEAAAAKSTAEKVQEAKQKAEALKTVEQSGEIDPVLMDPELDIDGTKVDEKTKELTEKIAQKPSLLKRAINFISKKVLPLVLTAMITLGIGATVWNNANGNEEATPSTAVETTVDNGETTEKTNPNAGVTEFDLIYDYDSGGYTSTEKVSKYAFSTDKSEFHGDVEKTRDAILEEDGYLPEVLAAHIYGIYLKFPDRFSEEEVAELHLSDAKNADEYDALFDKEGGGDLQTACLKWLKQALYDEENTKIEFEIENDSEYSTYIYNIQGDGGEINPKNMKLSYDLVKRDNAKQVNIYMKDKDGNWVLVLDLNEECGYQVNTEVEPEGLPRTTEEPEPTIKDPDPIPPPPIIEIDPTPPPPPPPIIEIDPTPPSDIEDTGGDTGGGGETTPSNPTPNTSTSTPEAKDTSKETYSGDDSQQEKERAKTEQQHEQAGSEYNTDTNIYNTTPEETAAEVGFETSGGAVTNETGVQSSAETTTNEAGQTEAVITNETPATGTVEGQGQANNSSAGESVATGETTTNAESASGEGTIEQQQSQGQYGEGQSAETVNQGL